MVSLGLQKGNNMEDETREDRLARRKRNYEKAPVYVERQSSRKGFFLVRLLHPFQAIEGGFSALESNPRLGVVTTSRMIQWETERVHNSIGDILDVAIGAVAADY